MLTLLSSMQRLSAAVQDLQATNELHIGTALRPSSRLHRLSCAYTHKGPGSTLLHSIHDPAPEAICTATRSA